MAKWLSSAGIKCTHEKVFNRDGWESALERIKLRRDNPSWAWQADSSWLAAPFLGRPEIDDMTIVHVVRHPKSTIDSFLRLILYADVKPFFDWATQFIPKIKDMNPVDSMAYWYVAFNEMIEPHADFRHRVEDNTTRLKRFLNIGSRDLYSDTLYNSRTGLGPSNVKLSDISPELRTRLLAMTERYGYVWEDAFVPETVEAAWWTDQLILLDSRSGYFGGSFQWRDTSGRPLAYDCNLVEFFYKKTKLVEHPFVVDVGASTGSFTLLPLLHSTMEVLAFEPNPVVFSVLESNVALHKLQNRVQLHQVALSDLDGTGILKVPNGCGHMALGCLGTPRPRGIDWHEAIVRTRTLDSYDLPALDFLKIDTEGNELNVLVGAEDTIKKFLPSILLEYQESNTKQFGYKPELMITLLKDWGYISFEQVGIEDMYVEGLRNHNNA